MAGSKKDDRGLVKRKTIVGKIVWYVRLSHEGKMRWFGPYPTKTEARQFYEDSKTDQRRGKFFPENFQYRGALLLKDFVETYMTTNRNKTVKEDRRYAKFWAERCPRLTLIGVSPTLIEQVKTELYTKNLADQSVLHYLKFLRHILNRAVRDGKLSRNPFVQVKLPKIPKQQLRYLNLEEEEKLLAELGPEYGPWIRFAILTGLRQGEQFRMQWTDVNLERGCVTLPDTKADESQYMFLNQEAKTILTGFTSWKDSKWVFPSANKGTQMHPTNFYHRVYAPAVKRAGLKKVNWHTLRHTFASRLAMSGATEQEIADCLRHEDTRLVQRYAHLSQTHLQGVMEKVSAFGKPKTNLAVSKDSVDRTEINGAVAADQRKEGLQPVE